MEVREEAEDNRIEGKCFFSKACINCKTALSICYASVTCDSGHVGPKVLYQLTCELMNQILKRSSEQDDPQTPFTHVTTAPHSLEKRQHTEKKI